MPITEIKSYNPDRGFGFLVNGGDEDADIFFHITNFKNRDGGSVPKEGERVSFVAKVGEKGLAAEKVERVSS